MLPEAVTTWRAFYRSCFKTYGITPAQYRALYLAQHGRCYICQVAKGVHPDDPKGRGTRRLGVDHNHLIGNNIHAVRGLLCSGGDKTCNRVIGWLNYDALRRAVRYLEESPAQRLFSADDYASMTDEQLTGWLT